MPTAKKPSAKPAAQKSTATKKTGAAAKKTTDKKANHKKTTDKKTTDKKTTDKKTAAKKTTDKKRTATAKSPTVRKPTTARAGARKKTSTRVTPNKATTKSTAPKKPATNKAATKRTTPRRAAQKKDIVKQTTTSRGLVLPVRPGEDPWTPEEVAEIREDLEREVARQREQLEFVDQELAGLLRDGSDGAGRDSADIGSSNFERDQEMSLAANAKAVLDQARDALQRIEDGSYGVCQNCGEPIGKGRLQAFPRASLCVQCKQREERR